LELGAWSLELGAWSLELGAWYIGAWYIGILVRLNLLVSKIAFGVSFKYWI
jgi:hypothetical protein